MQLTRQMDDKIPSHCFAEGIEISVYLVINDSGFPLIIVLQLGCFGV
jgi:hypothetical protein